jgi:hypothetical protein
MFTESVRESLLMESQKSEHEAHVLCRWGESPTHQTFETPGPRSSRVLADLEGIGSKMGIQQDAHPRERKCPADGHPRGTSDWR